MLELEVMKKDPAIKLFGKTISLPPDKVVSDVTASDDVIEQNQSSLATSTSQDSKDVSRGELIESKQKDDPINPTAEVYAEQEKNSLSPKTPKKNEPSESNVSQEKTLNKPDKVLPCPRCNSMETKFCYYNNYNVSQPRHFCKKCQRYWTAGGTMRNVPVGSGRRKSKNASVPNCRHIMVSDALQVAGADKVVNGMHFPSLKQNGFLIFGSDRLLGESMTVSPGNLAERSQNCARNEVYDNSIGSSSATSNSTEKGSNNDVQESGFPQPSWPCPLNSAQWIQNTPTAFVPSGFPVTFFPATPYWGCAMPSSWNVSLVSPLSSSGYSGLSKNSSSSTLGKHSRDEKSVHRPSNSLKEDRPEKKISDRCVLIPKTLRIDDPNEAAKSSIWSTLGIKSQKIDSVSGTSFFKSFQSKGDRNINPDSATKVLLANPAALSRSLNFHERVECD